MTIATRVSSRSARFWRGRLKTSGRAVNVWRSAAQRSTSNASLRPRPYRKTAKSLSNEITREMPSRSMSAKEVRSTREKSWSGKRSPIAHAASRSALVVCSMRATPLRRPPQKVSAALAEMKWCMRRHVSVSTWSLVISRSSVVRSRLARAFWRSPRSAAAYQAELSTKILMAHRNGDASRRQPPLRSCVLSPMRYPSLPSCRDRKRWTGQCVVGIRPGPDSRVGVCTRQAKCSERPRAHEFVYAAPN